MSIRKNSIDFYRLRLKELDDKKQEQGWLDIRESKEMTALQRALRREMVDVARYVGREVQKMRNPFVDPALADNKYLDKLKEVK
jgi:hypothetical protein